MVGDDTEVSIPLFGKMASIKGIGTIIVVIMLAFSGGLSYMLYDLSMSSSRAAVASTKAVEAAVEVQKQSVVEHGAIMSAARAITEAMSKVEDRVETQNIILLQDEAWKKKLKERIGMTKELRDLGMNGQH